ncbi:MAG: DUF262 domain-containing HNH endonuclease family protein, partial [Verrucomicrobiales bacterium]
MPKEHEIKSEKILIRDIFSRLWFRVPEYQRPYIWSSDEVNELLDDLTYALKEKPDQEYFLGSIVFQSKRAGAEDGQAFDENDLLDGQQRMTTLLMLFACMRDLSEDPEAKKDCHSCIYQEGSAYRRIPERNRLMFAIREEVQRFVDEFVKTEGGTDREADLEKVPSTTDDKSLQNMSRAILEIRRFFKDKERSVSPEKLLQFLLNNVLLIYVATQDLDDAFRLFTILNDRGVPLRNSDILKSLNLGALTKDSDKIRYAKIWEEAESELGDDFDRFLNHLRTILLKDKARLNLLQEFEHKIYSRKERDKTTGEKKPALLKKGVDTFQLIERYLRHHEALLGGNNYDHTGESFQFDNLIKVMQTGLPSTDWVPPLLRYFDKFKYAGLVEFLTKLDNKFSADWISQYTPTDRIERMNQVIKAIEGAKKPGDLFADSCFDIDEVSFLRNVETSVYGRRFTRYLLIKLDYLFGDDSHRLAVESLSVEHVLPQNPATDSQWCQDFTDEQRREWIDRLGNL